MAFDGKIMNLDNGAESLFDVKTETVIGKQKIHTYLPNIHLPDENDDIMEEVNIDFCEIKPKCSHC